MNRKIYNILMVGVGGQGIITASDIFALAALIHGFDAKKSEIHGMSQRGGSVFSHVRFGEKVHSPVIARGEVDILLSLEEMETLRWLAYANKKSLVVVSKTRIKPAMVSDYPEDMEQQLGKSFPNLLMVDPGVLSKRIENEKFFNVSLLGLIAPLLPISIQAWEKAIGQKVPLHFLEQNLNAFKQGSLYYDSIKKEVNS
ncbi:MAG: indolepyruvate oxidoreductase subunit beta [Spirochaetales bacterium]|nr:indolepyruvate oxidoreductase subunit beta [Spirochaetales bacterium]